MCVLTYSVLIAVQDDLVATQLHRRQISQPLDQLQAQTLPSYLRGYHNILEMPSGNPTMNVLTFVDDRAMRDHLVRSTVDDDENIIRIRTCLQMIEQSGVD